MAKMQNAFQGSLFATGYLTTSITQSQDWRDLGGSAREDIAPSTQMLRYLRRVEDLTTGKPLGKF